MKCLYESLLDVDQNIKNVTKNILLEDYENIVGPRIKELLSFNWDSVLAIARHGRIDEEGLETYSRAAKISINSAGKKYAKLLEKLLKPIFLGKSKKSLDEIKDEFINTDYFKDDAWEWAPNAGTDLFEEEIMDYIGLFEDVEIYMNEKYK